MEEVRAHLAERGVAFGVADLNNRARQIIERSAPAMSRIGKHMLFPSAEAAVAAYEASGQRT